MDVRGERSGRRRSCGGEKQRLDEWAVLEEKVRDKRSNEMQRLLNLK